MTDRRYTDDEVAAIFAAASTAADAPSQAPAPVSHDETGMTLVELQAIGREAGMTDDAVARAALALDTRGSGVSRRLLGLPIGVERTVALNRRLTDDEWERLVVELREVFDARGRTRAEGSMRQWWNGNLQVLLEPTATGHRVRLKTMNASARAAITTGLTAIGATAVLAMMGTAATDGRELLLLSVLGVGTFAYGALRLPGWARLRARQMEGIAARLAAPAAPGTPQQSALPPG